MRTAIAVYLDDFDKVIQARVWEAFHGKKFVSLAALERKIYAEEVSEETKESLKILVPEMEKLKAEILVVF